MRSDRECGRRSAFFFFSTYDLTNCVNMPMLIADLLSDTMESTWIPRLGWADFVPVPHSL